MSLAALAGLAGSDAVDAVAAVALLLFAFWGSRHGALRQVLGLGVVVAGFSSAATFGPRIEGQVAKVATFGQGGLACASYLTVWFGTVVVGGVALHLLRHALHRARTVGPLGRGVGGLAGVVQGVLLLGLALYGVLGWFAPSSGPNLVVSLRASRSARALEALESRARPMLRLPPDVADRVDLVNAQVVEEAGR